MDNNNFVFVYLYNFYLAHFPFLNVWGCSLNTKPWILLLSAKMTTFQFLSECFSNMRDTVKPFPSFYNQQLKCKIYFRQWQLVFVFNHKFLFALNFCFSLSVAAASIFNLDKFATCCQMQKCQLFNFYSIVFQHDPYCYDPPTFQSTIKM